MLAVIRSSAFKRDVKRAQRRGWDMEKLITALYILPTEKVLPAHYRDHALKGQWQGYREMHLEPDWLLIYRIAGTHAELFAVTCN